MLFMLHTVITLLMEYWIEDFQTLPVWERIERMLAMQLKFYVGLFMLTEAACRYSQFTYQHSQFTYWIFRCFQYVHWITDDVVKEYYMTFIYCISFITDLFPAV